MNSRLSTTWIYVLVLGFLVASGASAQTYTVTDLGSLGTLDTFAFAVNDSSRVAGYSYVESVPPPGFDRHAFLWQQGQVQDLGVLPGGSYSWGTDLNEAGQVCGFADDATGVEHLILYRNGAVEDLGAPTSGGEARGLNNLGQIAGYSLAESFNPHALFWSDSTGFVDLTAATAASKGLAEDLNDHTQVVGWSQQVPCGGALWTRATLWTDPGTGWTATDLGTLAGVCYSHAYDINEAGQIVGSSGNFTGTPVLWQKSSLGAWQIQSLGLLAGTTSGTAQAINNRGQIVGEAFGGGGVGRAFLWQCGAMIDLNTRLPAGSGWVLHSATGINDLGEIVGYGKLNGGNFRGFLLKPSGGRCCPGVIGIPSLDPS